MKPRTQLENELIQTLSALVGLDNEEVALYRSAIRRIKNEADRDALHRFMEEHTRHAAYLSLLVATLGGGPVPLSDADRDELGLARRARLRLSSLLGDKAVLEAVKRDEGWLRRAYLGTLRNPLPERVYSVIERNLKDELHHSAWIEERLDEQKRGTLS